MWFTLTDDDWKNLGLEEFQVSRTATAGFPMPDEGVGRSATQAVAEEEPDGSFPQSGDLVEIRLPDFAAPFIALESSPRQPGLLRIQVFDPQWKAKPLRVLLGALEPQSEDPQTLRVDLNRAEAVFFVGETQAIGLRQTGDRYDFVLLSHQAAPCDPPPPLPPLAAWADQAGDSWLAGKIRNTLERRGDWWTAVAAGQYGRLLKPSPRFLRDSQQSINVGEIPPDLTLLRTWCLSLPDQHIEHLEELALSEAARIADLVAAQPIASATPVLQAGLFAEMALDREALEETVWVLIHGKGGNRLEPSITHCDRECARLFEMLPLDQRQRIVANNEILRRAALCDPWAWWTAGAFDNPEGRGR